MSILISVLLIIDGFIYDLIGYLYEIFEFLAKINLFNQETYKDIVTNIYTVLGVVMLFVLAYSLLKAVINPENFSKGEQSFPKLIQNVVVSLIIIEVLPTVFSVAFNVQSSILNKDTIPKIVLGDDYLIEIGKTENTSPGHDMSYHIFSAFFHENPAYCVNKVDDYVEGDDEKHNECKETIKDDGGLFFRGKDNLLANDEYVKENKNASFKSYYRYSKAVAEDEIDYLMLISTVAGIFVAYVLLNFCFDMAVRVIKLMFFQIIAPIPVVCRILPGGKMKDVFPDWVKKTISTFVEVFIRIFILYLGLFMINQVITNFKFDIGTGGLGFTQLLIAKALLIMGVIIFIRQAPKLIGDMFHLDSGSMKLGIMDKLAMGGALTAAGAAGAMITQGGRNAISGAQKFKNAKGISGKIGAAAGMVGSTLTGGVSAGVRAGWAGKGAKNFKDVKTAASTGTQGATAAKDKRAAYIKYHSSKVKGGAGVFQTGATVAKGLLEDAGTSINEFWGIGESAGLSDLQKEQAIYKEGMGFKKNLFDLVSDNKSVINYQGLLKSTQEKDISEYIKKFYETGRLSKEGNQIFEALSDGSRRLVSVEEIEGMAIQAKEAEIDKYDTAIKLASMRAIHDKLDSGDGRFTAQFNAFETFKKQHADNELVSKLTMVDLTQDQLDAIDKALYSNSGDAIDNVKKMLEAAPGSIMANDKQFKIKNGDVTAAIAKKAQEQKAKEGK